jgi:hypothetical protein
MAQLDTQFVNRETPLSGKTFAECTSTGDQFSAGDDVYLEVKNTSGSAATCTVATPGSVDGIDLDDYEFTVPATTGDVEVGPFESDLFGAQAVITYSAVSDLTIAVKQYGS